MKQIQQIGLILFLISLIAFTACSFLGEFELTSAIIESNLKKKQHEHLSIDLKEQIGGKVYTNPGLMANDIAFVYNSVNEQLKTEEKWDQVMYESPQGFAFDLVKDSAKGIFIKNTDLLFLSIFGLGIFGSLLFILSNLKLLGPPGIKNHHIYDNVVTNRGWVGWLTLIYLVGFYVLLYFYPSNLVNQVLLVNPISKLISGNEAGRWFLYGFLYSVVMSVMGIRMLIKYRHNKYQIIRTFSVLFFQICFAFTLPEILVRFNKPYMDLKNAWPLDYDFFFEWNINGLIENGRLGVFMLFWGVVLTLVIVPLFSYLFGKRWYCSWVCGCGGLSETLGDPYRQLSDKSLKSWKFERYIVHGVLVFAILMTFMTLYTYFSEVSVLFGVSTFDVQKIYGFLIGSIFAGVIGTGFYPIFGSRVWCRFGCPLAAYLGLVQRFKSRFRITTNGAQCISCGNCSTYCEQGIDVRSYAQRGEDIVRASCVGCGICSAVCPRGVLKLENAPEDTKKFDYPISINEDGFHVQDQL